MLTPTDKKERKIPEQILYGYCFRHWNDKNDIDMIVDIPHRVTLFRPHLKRFERFCATLEQNILVEKDDLSYAR